MVLAVSGGPDSTALMHLAAAWRPRDLPMWVASVDHGLRPEARHEAEAVMTAAAALALPAAVLAWTGPKPDHRLQERARTARYGLLFDFAREVDASHVVTAHTLDDQAETLLMRIAAGSGPTGLAGMRVLTRRGDITLARPFLGLRKALLVGLCRDRGWPFGEDPANADERFARTRWRRLAPRLAAEGLTAERLGQLAARLARAEASLQACADAVSRETIRHGTPGTRCFAAALLGQEDEMVLRVLDAALGAVGTTSVPRLGRLERLLSTLRDAAGRKLPVRRTLRGCLVTMDPEGGITIRAESPRGNACQGAAEQRAGPPTFHPC